MLKLVPLGGLGEIGLNCMLIELKESSILIDAGLMFPDEQMPGVDIVIPDLSYLEENKEKLKAIILTHGHEDHIGALPFILKNISAPIYGTSFTIKLVEQKLEEYQITNASLNIINPGDITSLFPFEIEYLRVEHSIIECLALVIKTNEGTIIHSGDFKIDTSPFDNCGTDLAGFARYGEKNVLILLSDSTNVEKDGYSLSELAIAQRLEKFFCNRKGRIFIALFPSNIARIHHIFQLCQKYNCKVYLDGKSMVTNINIARQLGILKVPHDLFLSEKRLEGFPEERTVILTTGTQGEPMSSLSRISHDSHKTLKIKKGDLVILSSRLIPGNERAINNLINRLYRLGADVAHESVAEIHTSGHAKREELRLLINLVRPRYFIPIHGEYRHLAKHGELAVEAGIPRERVLILENGDVACFSKGSFLGLEKVPHGRVLVDGKGVGDVEEIVLRDRRRLSSEGIVMVLVVMEDQSKRIIYGPEVVSKGFVTETTGIDLMQEAKRVTHQAVEEMVDFVIDKELMAEEIKRRLKKLFVKALDRRPLIVPTIIIT